MSENSNGVYAALAKAQAEFPAITRDRTVKVTSKKTGASYTFAYAPLETIMEKVGPVLSKHGLSVSQPFAIADTGGPVLETILAHEDGSMIRGSLPLPAHHESDTAQDFGGIITYYRRYSLVAILGLATEEDDDANGASGNTAQTVQQRGSQNGGDGPVPDAHGQQQARGDAVEPGQVLVPFGKHKGKQVKDVPRDYWDWWLAQDGNKNQEVLAAVELHLGLTAAPAGDTLDPDLPF